VWTQIPRPPGSRYASRSRPPDADRAQNRRDAAKGAVAASRTPHQTSSDAGHPARIRRAYAQHAPTGLSPWRLKSAHHCVGGQTRWTEACADDNIQRTEINEHATASTIIPGPGSVTSSDVYPIALEPLTTAKSRLDPNCLRSCLREAADCLPTDAVQPSAGRARSPTPQHAQTSSTISEAKLLPPVPQCEHASP